MRYIVRGMSSRQPCILYLKSLLPQAEFMIDVHGNAMAGFLCALRVSGADAVVHMEEDVIITSNFTKKIESVISKYPNNVIQFFSMRDKDITVGSRYEPGRTFCMGQCFYLPAGYSAAVLKYWDRWPNKTRHPTGLDLMVGDFLKSRGEKYLISVPSLVNHRCTRSLIDPRRSSKRGARVFIDGVPG